MAMDNRQIADRLEAFAALLELSDANPYTTRAYRRAAETIRSAPLPVAELVRAGRVRQLRGIGAGIEGRLRELIDTGEIAELAELERELLGGMAQALDGEAAGDVRRWRDSCERLAVVCATQDPRPVVKCFAALPQIVAMLEQADRRAVGVTVDGVPVELTVAEPERFG